MLRFPIGVASVTHIRRRNHLKVELRALSFLSGAKKSDRGKHSVFPGPLYPLHVLYETAERLGLAREIGNGPG